MGTKSEMKTDWWEKIERTYHHARGLKNEEGSRFLDDVCGSDAAMRRQIEARLQQDDNPNSLLNRPAVELAAKWPSLAGSLKVLTGTRVGAYEILEPIGAGGMGDVYRARDTKLHRDVALKFLPAHLATDPDRLLRFRREAQVLAAVNHPHIAQIYGLEETDSTYCIAMELVDGETLAERVRRGPIPVGEALRIAKDIAEGLEAAHEKGIVHRDLKPANVKVTPEGQVKVLDFGLAKAPRSTSTPTNVSDSPTRTIEATNTGIILGTAPYMSPEQAKGTTTDHRTDVFSLGCVLYEMLTGRQAFQGETVSDVIASVLARDPDLGRLPLELNPKVRDLIRRCLDKDVRSRWQAIGDVRIEIEAILADPSGWRVRDAGPQAKPLWKRGIPLVATALVATAVGAAVVWNMRLPAPATITRFNFTLPEGVPLIRPTGGRGIPVVAVSPDGSRMAFPAKNEILIRDTSDTEFHRVFTAEENIGRVFFSPDGRWLAFDANRKLYKIGVAGGAPVPICEIDHVLSGASWDSNDQILIGAGPLGIQRISAAGGNPETIVTVKPGEFAFTPQLLPDGENILFTLAEGPNTNGDKAEIVVQSLKSGMRTVIIPRGSNARFVPPGYIVYTIGSTLWAQAFKVNKLQPIGEPVRVVEGVMRAGASGTAYFSSSSNGVMAYVPNRAGLGLMGPRSLALIELDGRVHTLDVPAGRYDKPRFSADGKQIAVETDDGGIFIYDLAGTKPMRKLPLEGRNQFPAWTPDGHVAFAGDKGLFWQRADASSRVELLMEAEAGFRIVPFSVSTDGKTLLGLYGHSSRQPASPIFELMMLPLEGARTPKPLFRFQFNRDQLISFAVLSPDRKWLAYEQGQSIYVEPFPRTGAGPYPITTDGGSDPMWSIDGKKLFYLDRNRKTLFSVDILRTAPGFESGKPTPLFSEGRLFYQNSPGNAVDFSPKRNQFVTLLLPNDIDATTHEVTVVLNWLAELKQRVPLK